MMDYNALRTAAQQNKQIEDIALHLLSSPRFAAAAAALWPKVEIVDICERAGKLINNFTVTVIVQGTQVTHAASSMDDNGIEGIIITGGGMETFNPPKLR